MWITSICNRYSALIVVSASYSAVIVKPYSMPGYMPVKSGILSDVGAVELSKVTVNEEPVLIE